MNLWSPSLSRFSSRWPRICTRGCVNGITTHSCLWLRSLPYWCSQQLTIWGVERRRFSSHGFALTYQRRMVARHPCLATRSNSAWMSWGWQVCQLCHLCLVKLLGEGTRCPHCGVVYTNLLRLSLEATTWHWPGIVATLARC